MAQRINISIPDELHADLEKWRDQLNVSGICQEALRKEAARLEAVATAGDDLDAVVKRLRAEKDEWEKHWYEVGVQLGYEWARRARYRRLLESLDHAPAEDVVEFVTGFSKGTMMRRESTEKVVVVYPSIRHVLEEVPRAKGFVRLREYNTARLCAGWLKGVRDFWNQIKDAL